MLILMAPSGAGGHSALGGGVEDGKSLAAIEGKESAIWSRAVAMKSIWQNGCTDNGNILIGDPDYCNRWRLNRVEWALRRRCF